MHFVAMCSASHMPWGGDNALGLGVVPRNGLVEITFTVGYTTTKTISLGVS
jgi:hypothetical protein